MLKDLFTLIFSHLSFSLFCLAILCAFYECRQKEGQWFFAHIWFKWIAVLVFGFTGIYGFFMHGFCLETTAKAMGLKPSPFQLELALCNLAFGLLGILCYKNDFSFRKATTLTAVVYWFGAGILQTSHMIKMKKFALPYSLTWYAMDIIVPVLLVIFLIISCKQSSKKKHSWFR